MSPLDFHTVTARSAATSEGDEGYAMTKLAHAANEAHRREAAAVLADWREIERAIRELKPSIAKERAGVAELAELHAEARRLRVEYAEIIRGPAVPSRGA